MNTKTKNILLSILAVVAGWLIGSIVNMSLINVGLGIYPIEGYDGKDMDFLAKVMPTLSSEYFIFPFLAHALGTFVGAILAALIAPKNYKMKAALIVGLLFFIGGILVNIMISGPVWFTAVDILLAYFPMAWIGGKIALAISKK